MIARKKNVHIFEKNKNNVSKKIKELYNNWMNDSFLIYPYFVVFLLHLHNVIVSVYVCFLCVQSYLLIFAQKFAFPYSTCVWSIGDDDNDAVIPSYNL